MQQQHLTTPEKRQQGTHMVQVTEAELSSMQ
jgi:hypothetical protein